MNDTATASQQSPLTYLVHERLGERRFHALAAAIREHEAEARAEGGELSGHDAELYRQLRLICGEL
ncbi:MAG: hypothetical protein ACRDK5_05065 [Solirubrobacterales bacterium]